MKLTLNSKEPVVEVSLVENYENIDVVFTNTETEDALTVISFKPDGTFYRHPSNDELDTEQSENAGITMDDDGRIIESNEEF